MATITKRQHRETRNTYGLPQGEPLRRELVRWFRKQRTVMLEWLATGKVETKKEGGDLPGTIPDWDWFGLGSLPMSERMTPHLEAIWDEQGRKFASKIGLDPDVWEVTNPKTQEAIDNAALAFCAETNATTTLDMNDALQKTREALGASLIEHGESVRDLTKRIKKIFTGAETWRARRIAASEASRATHAAQEMQAKESGVVTGWEWLASEDACPLCVLPWTRIWPIGFVGAVKTIYHGPTVLITCSDGSRLAVTPNHLLLTPDGLVPASTLVKGDDVVCCPLLQGHRWTKPNDHYEPAYADDVFRSLAELGHAKRRSMPSGPEHLHGDGAFCQGNIDIVGTNGFLSPSVKPGVGEHGSEFGLSDSSVASLLFDPGSDPASTLKALGLAVGSVGRSRDLQAIRLAGARKAKQLCLAVGSELNPEADEAFLDGKFVGNKFLSETLDCLSRQVTTCKVIRVDWEHYCGPVYDFETYSSLYITENGLTSSNCQTVARKASHVKLGQPFAIVGTNPTYSQIDMPPLHPSCQCSAVPVLDVDKQPQWSPTLEQPEPEEQDYAEGEAPESAKKPKQPPPPRVSKPTPLPKKKPKAEPGTKVGDYVTLPEGIMGKQLDRVVKAVESVHDVSHLSRVNVEPAPADFPNRGAYFPYLARPDKPELIQIRRDGTHRNLTLAHEMGHWIGTHEFELYAGSADWGYAPKAKGFLEAVKASDTYKKLEAGLASDPFPNYRQYLLRHDELWARSYAQWIATRSDNEVLKAELSQQAKSRIIPEQWTKAEFEPIGKAIDALFRDAGLLK